MNPDYDFQEDIIPYIQIECPFSSSSCMDIQCWREGVVGCILIEVKFEKSRDFFLGFHKR